MAHVLPRFAAFRAGHAPDHLTAISGRLCREKFPRNFVGFERKQVGGSALRRILLERIDAGFACDLASNAASPAGRMRPSAVSAATRLTFTTLQMLDRFRVVKRIP